MYNHLELLIIVFSLPLNKPFVSTDGADLPPKMLHYRLTQKMCSKKKPGRFIIIQNYRIHSFSCRESNT